jgi:hypothetical protein
MQGKKKGGKMPKVEGGAPAPREIFKKRIEFFSPHFYLVLKGGILNQLFNFLDRV